MYELWDTDSGNIVGTYDTLTNLVQAAYNLGQANQYMNSGYLSAAQMREDEIETPFEQLSDEDKRWAAEGWLEQEADNEC